MQKFLEAQIHESEARKRASKHKRDSFIVKSLKTKTQKEQGEKILPNIPLYPL